MAANNEIGTLEPLKEIGQIAHEHGILFHTDAVQAFGQIPINVDEFNIDMLSSSGHKINGPKGIGFLYIRKGVKIRSFVHGGAQERKRRAGTENVPGIVGYGLGKANEVTVAIQKGIEDAKKNLVKIPVINKTIPHEQVARFGGAEVFMKPAAPGTGVKAGGAMRAVFESVGIQNVLAKSKGSSNPHNLVKATVAALTELRDAYTVAGLRGVPMSKVFNG